MPTFGTIFSGIGGADWGMENAGYTPLWQCERDPWRRKVLEARWPDVERYREAASLPWVARRADLVYAHPVRSDPEFLALVWPLVDAIHPSAVVLEVGCRCTVAVRERLGSLGYSGIGLTVTIEQSSPWLALPMARQCPVVVGWRGPLADLRAHLADAKLSVHLRDGEAGPPATVVEFVERIRGLPCGWTCVCGTPEPDRCSESSARIVAANEATVPDLAKWIVERLLPLLARQEVLHGNR